jgi:MFS transporter, NNP family, nitrate/nitrite transporter
MAWRTVCVVPAVVGFFTGICLYLFSDDAPKGNYQELKMNGALPEVSAAASFRSGAINFNTWLLFL